MLNHILASLNDYALAFDRFEAKYSFISNGIDRLTGRCIGDFKKSSYSWEEIIDKRDIEKIRKQTELLTEGQTIDLTYRIITSLGLKWIKEKRTLFTDETGHEILLSVIKDIQQEEAEKYNQEEAIAGYSILFDNNPSPMWIYDLESRRLLKANTATLKTYGYTEDEFLLMTLEELLINTKGEKISSHLFYQPTPVALQGFHYSGIWKHQNKRGDTLYAEVTSDSISYKGHNCRIIIANNVTEKIKSQEEVKLREQFLNSLIDSQTNFLIRIDINGKFTFVNRQFLKILGYTKKDIIGKNYKITSIPEEQHLCENAFYDCINHPGKVINLAHKKVDKAGGLHDTEWEFIAITDDTGSVTGVQGVGQDVTARTTAQKEVVWTKNNLEALINNTIDLIWSVDRNYNYLYMNQAYKTTIVAYAGEAPEKGTNSLHSVFDKEELNRWVEYYDRVFKGERYFIVNESVNPATKEKVFAEISFNPIYNSEGIITGAGCFSHDISDRIKSNEEIIEQNERLQNIASISSHELRRPVATMLGLINIIDLQDFNNPENKEIIEHISTVGTEIDDVIRLIVNKTFV